MASAVEITIDELMAEYDRLGIGSGQTNDPEFLCCQEWADKWGFSMTHASRLIRKFHAAGMVTVGRKLKDRITGSAVMVAAYKITPPAKQKQRPQRSA